MAIFEVKQWALTRANSIGSPLTKVALSSPLDWDVSVGVFRCVLPGENEEEEREIRNDELVQGLCYVKTGEVREAPWTITVGQLGSEWQLRHNYHVSEAKLTGPRGREQRLAPWFDLEPADFYIF